jgi:hypothetical protein
MPCVDLAILEAEVLCLLTLHQAQQLLVGHSHRSLININKRAWHTCPTWELNFFKTTSQHPISMCQSHIGE